MIPLPVTELQGLGRLEATADEVTGVQIDSRRVRPGDLFVAVRGGVAYVEQARAAGAGATLVPDDDHAAMAAIGRAVRDRSSAEVVGITGSTGKTSTKDILAALVAPHRKTVAAEASYNAELGVPLTLARLEPGTELLIAELAMRGFGQIRDLCEIARPTLGAITAVGPVHLEFVGDVAGVARAKAELLQALPSGATAVVPAGVPELEPHLRDDLNVIRVGEDVRLRSWSNGRHRGGRAGRDCRARAAVQRAPPGGECTRRACGLRGPRPSARQSGRGREGDRALPSPRRGDPARWAAVS